MKPLTSGFSQLLLFVCLLIPACAKTSAIHFKCLVTDQNHLPIEGAVISLNGQGLANSNKDGHIDLRLKVDQENTLNFIISKSSDEFYFDTSTLSVQTPKSQRYEASFEAVLRAMPKSFEQQSLPSMDSTKALEIAPSEPVTSNLPIQRPEVEKKHPAGMMANEVTGPIESTAFDQDGDGTAMAENFLPLNIHVRSHAKAVAGATVYISNPKSATYLKACETNERGRCLLNISPVQRARSFLLVRQAGFHSQTVDLSKVDESIGFIDLKGGHSIDIFALLQTWQGDQGLPNLEVFIGDRAVGKTDSNGFYSMSSDDLLPDDQLLYIRSPNFIPTTLSIPVKKGAASTLIKSFVEPHAKVKVAFAPVKIEIPSNNSDLRTTTAQVQRGIQSAIVSLLQKQKYLEHIDSKEAQSPSTLQFQFLATSVNERKWELTVRATSTLTEKSLIQGLAIADTEDFPATSETIQQAVQNILDTIRPATSVTSAAEGQLNIGLGASNSTLKVGDRLQVLSFAPAEKPGLFQDTVIGEVQIKSQKPLESTGTFTEKFNNAQPMANDVLIYKQGEKVSWLPKHKLKNPKM